MSLLIEFIKQLTESTIKYNAIIIFKCKYVPHALCYWKKFILNWVFLKLSMDKVYIFIALAKMHISVFMFKFSVKWSLDC